MSYEAGGADPCGVSGPPHHHNDGLNFRTTVVGSQTFLKKFARKTYKQIGSSHNGEQGSSSAGCCHGGRGFLAVGSVRFDRCDPSPDPCHNFTASPRIFAAMLPSIPAAESADMGDSSAADSDKRQ